MTARIKRSCLFPSVVSGQKTLVAEGYRGLITEITAFALCLQSGSAMLTIYLNDEIIHTETLSAGTKTFDILTGRLLSADEKVYISYLGTALAGIGTITRTLTAKC